MSRSIRGYSSANLTIESLSLLGIDVTTIDATTGNIITLNSTTVNATNGNITNLSIGTLTIDNATVNQLLTANNITASGTITANGNVVINSLLLDNTDNNDRYITFQGVGNVLHGDSKLTFNPNTNTLKIIILSCQDINATGTISATNFNIVAENKTASTNYPISFHDTSTDRVSIGDASYLSSFTFNPSTRTMVLENGQITNATITDANIAIANITDANINANSRSDDVEYKVVLLRASDNRICEDSSNNITYNPFNERLTVVKTTTTNLKIGQLLTTSNDTFYPCMFQGNNNDISQAPLLANFHYNPSQLKLKIDNVEVTDDLTVTDDLIVGGRTDLGTIVSIDALNTTVINTSYRVLLWDNTSSSSKTIRSDSNVYYDTTDNTLHAPNFSGNFSITAQTRSGSTDYPVLFYDTSTNEICIDSTATNITWNPSSNVLDVRNINVAVDLDVVGNITAGTNLNTPLLTLTGTNNATFNVDTSANNFGLLVNSNDGYVFRMNNNVDWKFRIQSTQTTIYNDLLLDTGILKTPNIATDLKLRIAGNDKVVIEDTKTCIKNTLCLESVTIPSTSTQFPVLLLNEGTNEVKKTDAFMSYDPTIDRIYAKDIMINDAGTSGRLTLVEPIRYGGTLFYTPLNYTYIIGNTDTIATIDVLGSGLNSGKYGNGVYMGILRSGVKATAFSNTATDLWTWNQYISATNTATQFTCNSLISGTWEITVMCDYTSSSGSGSNRVNPIMRLELNGTEIEEGTQSLYIRHQLGRVGTMRTNYILKLTTGDDIMLRTYVNFGGTINYSSSIASADFTLSNFNFRATFLGPLEEYDRTPA